MVLSIDMLKRILFGTKMWLVKSSWDFRKTLHASPAGEGAVSYFLQRFSWQKGNRELEGRNSEFPASEHLLNSGFIFCI